MLLTAVLVGAGIVSPIFADSPHQKPRAVQKHAVIRFAIAGNIDFDGDGNSDLELLRRLIAMNGGVIDAELDSQGQLTGQLRANTTYLLEGTFPGNAAASPQTRQQYEAFRRRARERGLRIIDVDCLLMWGPRRPVPDERAASGFRQRKK